MTIDLRNTEISSLREWLRNDRLLGIEHWAVPRVVLAAPPRGMERENSEDRPTLASRERARIARPVGAASQPVGADDKELPPVVEGELSEAEARKALLHLQEGWVKNCSRCVLRSGCKQTVFGEGASRPELVFVGEGPGAEEDIQGRPFVGRAGQLLTRMIAAMTLTRDQVFICNVVKCRPPGNRTPTDDEVEACWPYLARQLAILRPKVIVTLGKPASQMLLQTKTPISRLRGEFHDFPPMSLGRFGMPSAKLMPTFHPAYLLRSPGEKGKSWEDLKQVMQYLGIPLPSTH